MTRRSVANAVVVAAVLGSLFVAASAVSRARGDDKKEAQKKDEPSKSSIVVDKAGKSVEVPCKVAPRKLAKFKEIYPIEVIASWPEPKGQKAHECVVTFDVLPSEVHKALAELGLKPGKPGRGQGPAGTGPELKVSLEFPGADGKPKRLAIEETLVDRKSGKSPAALKWRFTGSAMKNPDPEKDDLAYGADLSGTLITVFPVTDDTVVQSTLSGKDEATLKLDTNSKVLPKEGTPGKLIIEVK